MKKVEKVVKSKKYIAIIIVSFVLIVIGLIRTSYASDTCSNSNGCYSRSELQDSVIATAFSYLYNQEYSDYSQKAIVYYNPGNVFSKKSASEINSMTVDKHDTAIYYTDGNKTDITKNYKDSRKADGKNGSTQLYSTYIASYPSTGYYFRNINQDPDTFSRTNQIYIDCSGFVTLVYKYGLNIDITYLFGLPKKDSNGNVIKDKNGKEERELATNTDKLTTFAEKTITEALKKKEPPQTLKKDTTYKNVDKYVVFYRHITKNDTISTVVNSLIAENGLQPGDLFMVRGDGGGHIMLYVGDKLKSGDHGIIHATGEDMLRGSYYYSNSGKDKSNSGKDKISIQYTSSFFQRLYKLEDKDTVNTKVVVLRPVNGLLGKNSNTTVTIDDNTVKKDGIIDGNTKAVVKKSTRRVYLQSIRKEQYAATSDNKLITKYSTVPAGSYIKYVLNLKDMTTFKNCEEGTKDTTAKACDYNKTNSRCTSCYNIGSRLGRSRKVLKITAKVPTDTKYVSCTGNCTCSANPCIAGSTLTWSLPSGQTGLLGTFSYTVDALSKEGEIVSSGFSLTPYNPSATSVAYDPLALGNINVKVGSGTRKLLDREILMNAVSKTRSSVVYESNATFDDCSSASTTNKLYSASFLRKVYCEAYNLNMNDPDKKVTFNLTAIRNNFFSKYNDNYPYDFNFTPKEGTKLTKMYVKGMYGGTAVRNAKDNRARYITEADFEVGDLIAYYVIDSKNSDSNTPSFKNYIFMYAGNSQFITLFSTSSDSVDGKITVYNNQYDTVNNVGKSKLSFDPSTSLFINFDSKDYFVNDLHNKQMFVVLRPSQIMTTVKYTYNGGKSTDLKGNVMNYYSFLASETYKNLLPESRLVPPTGKYTVTYAGLSGAQCGSSSSCPTSIQTSSLMFGEWQVDGVAVSSTSELKSTNTHTVKAIWEGEFTLPIPSKSGYLFKGWIANKDIKTGSHIYGKHMIKAGYLITPDVAGKIRVPANTTLTAQWAKYVTAPTASKYCKKTTNYDYLIYNGKSQTLVDDPDTGFNWSGTITGINAGSYTVTAALKSGYVWSNSSNSTANMTINCSITQKNLSITAKNQTITVGSSISTGTSYVTASGLVSGETISGVTLTPSTSSITTTGKITPSAVKIENSSGSDVTKNYKISYNVGTLTIKEVAKYYTTFDSNGGTSVSSQQVTKGSYVTAPTSPTRSGYDFTGWYTDEALTNMYDFTTPVTGDLKLYAKWTAKRYFVTFNTRGGSSINSQNVAYGEKATRPTNPTKKGYTFVGWYTTQELTTSYDFSRKVTKAVVLFAKWNITNYYITYSLGGGQATNPNKYTVETSTFTLNRPTKTGYTFTGWMASNISTPQLDVTISKGTTGNKSFVAKYDIIKYTVEFNTNGGSAVSSQQVIYGGKVAEPVTPTKAGYAFEGWYTDSGLTNRYDFTTETYSNKILYASWISGKKQITYNLKGGIADNPTYYDSSTSSFTLDNPEKEGSVFVGWTGSNGTTPQLDVTVNPSEISNVSHIYEKTKYRVVMLADPDDTGDLNYTANYTDATYTISFSYEGLENIEKQYGEALTLPTPEKEGYRFLGWYRDEQLTEEFTNDTMPAENITLYPKFEINIYQLIFITNGGNAIDSLDVTYNENIPNLPTPEKEGYGFLGWYTDEELTTEFNIEKMPSSDLTLYAKWQASTYTVHFNTNGGSSIYDVVVIQGDELAKPSDPTKEGYLFNNWYSDSNFTTLYDFDLPVTSDLTLYAKWEIMNYTIDYDLDGGTVSGNPTSYNIETPTFTLNSPTKEGYTFVGWVETGVEVPSTNVTIEQGNVGNRRYTAHYEVNNYTITFNTNGGSAVNPITAPYGEVVEEPVTPTKEGYKFAGWYSDSELTRLYTFTIMPAENITLYAKWTNDNYIINYVLNGGVNDETNPTSYNGGDEKELEDPTRVGYRFLGWYSEEAFTNKIDIIAPDMTGDITLYAKWEAIDYLIMYETNGGITIPDVEKHYNSSITLPVPEKEGNTFLGWYSDSELTELFTLETMPAYDVILYAKWEVNTYTISFDSNGGNKINPITAEYNSIINEPNQPLRNGYKFAGWYTDNKLTNLFSFDRMPSKDITLYAKWVANGKNTIKYVLNGGKNSTKNKTTYKYGDIVKLYKPKKEGYEFLGWYLEKDYQTRIRSIKDMSGDLVLYAKWAPLGEIEVPDTGSNVKLVAIVAGIVLISTGTYFVLNRKPNMQK